MIKTFIKHFKMEALATHFNFTSFSTRPFYSSWTLFFTPGDLGCFGLASTNIASCLILSTIYGQSLQTAE